MAVRKRYVFSRIAFYVPNVYFASFYDGFTCTVNSCHRQIPASTMPHLNLQSTRTLICLFIYVRVTRTK